MLDVAPGCDVASTHEAGLHVGGVAIVVAFDGENIVAAHQRSTLWQVARCQVRCPV